MNKWIFLLVALIIICFIVEGKATDKEIIKIKLGTFAPPASDWGKILNQMKKELMTKSDGQLQFNIRHLDEGDVIERMKKGQLDAASLTATGLGHILKASFIFQLPMLFDTYDELDYVRDKLSPEFSKMFKDKRYVLLGWGDLGFIHLFSKECIVTQNDLKKKRNWAWSIDPIGKKFVSECGREAILLPIGKVKSALENNDIQTVYTSPYACLIFQWHTELNYMSDLRLAAGVGATIISKRKYDRLSSEHQRLLQKVAEQYHEELVEIIRDKNEESIGVLQGLPFSIELRHQINLDEDNISRNLRQAFENNGISLPQNVTVSIEEKDSEWLITDKNGEKICFVRKEESKLNIYQGIMIIDVPPQEKDKWFQVAKSVQSGFAGDQPGNLYKKELLDKVRSLLKEYRSKNKR